MDSIGQKHSNLRRMARAHYVAFLLPTDYGEWRVLFPDLPECKARDFTVHDAAYAAEAALARRAEQTGRLLPLPRGLAQIERDLEWLSRTGVDVRKSVVTIVPLYPDRT
jgi:hypothetical protein